MASTLTAEHIVAIYTDPNTVTKDQAEKYLPYLVAACQESGITTKLRVAGFLSQLGAESGELIYWEELADGSAYEWRRDLGNIYEGDGRWFKGHGPIQITGRGNHTACGEALGLDLVNNPTLIGGPHPLSIDQIRNGFRSAGWYWTKRGNNLHHDEPDSPWYQQWPMNLNEFADEGDINALCIGVNGGWNGYDARVTYYNKALEVLPDDLDLSTQDTGAADPVTEYETLLVDRDSEGWIVARPNSAFVRYINRPDAALHTNAEGWFYAPDWEDGPAPENGEESDQVRVSRNPRGWIVDGTGAYLCSDAYKDAVFRTDSGHWLYGPNTAEPVPVKKGLRHPGSGWYVEQHPTHHDWREDVKALVDKVEAEFDDIYINTYWNHPPIPENYDNRYDAVSLDVWDSDGRGYALDWYLHDEVLNRLFYDPNPPNISWYLSKGYLWTPERGLEKWPDYDIASDAQHNNHLHVTYQPYQ